MHRIVCIVIVALAGLLPARAADLPPQKTRAAQELYDTKCAKCHKFYNPAEYSQEEWDLWTKKMSKKAKLRPAQSELLAQYLQGFREKAGAQK